MEEIPKQPEKVNINWEDEIRAYYKNLPYHDKISMILDGKCIIIPKKIYDIEALNKTLQLKGLNPVLLNLNEK